ncbi:hypothetical protein ACN3XK_35285 [Actinomadura welshii]
MSNSVRWTLVGVLLAFNALSNLFAGDGAVGIAVSAVTGLAVLALVIGFFVRRRREQ